MKYVPQACPQLAMHGTQEPGLDQYPLAQTISSLGISSWETTGVAELTRLTSTNETTNGTAITNCRLSFISNLLFYAFLLSIGSYLKIMKQMACYVEFWVLFPFFVELRHAG